MTRDTPDLILASASPRRRELLQRLGLLLRVIPVDLDESVRPAEGALTYVRRLAAEKCAAAGARIGAHEQHLAVLAADTTVVVGGDILGKPTGTAEAASMLQQLAGRRHEVITAYSIARGPTTVHRAVTTTVAFRLLSPAEIAAYIACGEWRGKAGGYAIQGIAALFATEIRGSLTNVIGLPLAEVIADLQAAGALPNFPPPGFGVPE